MNKGLKGLIVAGLILVGVGLTVTAVGVMAGGFNFSKLGIQYNDVEKEIKEDFSNISVEENVSTISIHYYDGDSCKVNIKESEYEAHIIEVVDDTLSIKVKDSNFVLLNFSVGLNRLTTVINLPKKAYENISVKSDTGSIKIDKEFTFNKANIETNTGSITFNAKVNSDVSFKTNTGSINASDAKLSNTIAKTRTGSIKFKNCEVGEIKSEVSTGSLTFESSKAVSLESNGSTGSVHLNNSTLSGDLKIKRTTGSITFNRFDAENLECKTGTGSIRGTLLSEKIFSAQSKTGKVKVPFCKTGGAAIFETNTGSIEIEIVY